MVAQQAHLNNAQLTKSKMPVCATPNHAMVINVRQHIVRNRVQQE